MIDPTLLTAAIERRRIHFEPTLHATDAFRLVHGTFDALPGITIDALADVANLRIDPSVHSQPEAVLSLARLVVDAEGFGIDQCWVTADETRKDNARTDAAFERACNELLERHRLFPARREWSILENGWRFLVRRDAGFSYGIFLDMREVRRALSERWTGRTVANLFSYACAFSVPLAVDNEVSNVDVSQPYLDWGVRNHEVNGLTDRARFYRKDAFEFLEFAARRGFRYDAIILDPPVFSHGKRKLSRRFQIGEDFDELVSLALRSLSDDGELFVSTNFEAMTRDEFDARLAELARRHGRRVLRWWPPAPDFPAPPDRYHLKTALVG